MTEEFSYQDTDRMWSDLPRNEEMEFERIGREIGCTGKCAYRIYRRALEKMGSDLLARGFKKSDLVR